MPLIDVNYVDPYTGESRDTGWAFAAFTAFDWDGKGARIVYNVYATRDAAYGGKPPIRTVEIRLGPEGQPALTMEEELEPGVPAVLSPPDPVTGEREVLTPEVPPVTRTVVLKQALPGLPELVNANAAAYGALLDVVDGLALLLPEFDGATKESGV